MRIQLLLNSWSKFLRLKKTWNWLFWKDSIQGTPLSRKPNNWKPKSNLLRRIVLSSNSRFKNKNNGQIRAMSLSKMKKLSVYRIRLVEELFNKKSWYHSLIHLFSTNINFFMILTPPSLRFATRNYLFLEVYFFLMTENRI